MDDLTPGCSIISKIRHRKLNVGPTILLRMHEKSNIPIGELKELTSASARVH